MVNDVAEATMTGDTLASSIALLCAEFQSRWHRETGREVTATIHVEPAMFAEIVQHLSPRAQFLFYSAGDAEVTIGRITFYCREFDTHRSAADMAMSPDERLTDYLRRVRSAQVP